MGDSYESVKLRQYVKYINIISTIILIVSLVCVGDLYLCAYSSYTTPKESDENSNKEETTQSILLTVIITLAFSTILLLVSSILLFIFAMKIIHVTEVSRILKNIYSTSKSTIHPLLQNNEEPSGNTIYRPRTANLYTTDRDQKIMSKKEDLFIYDEVNDEPSFPSNRCNIYPPTRKESITIVQLPDYDEVKEFNVTSNSRIMLPPANEDELPEYHEPTYPNVSNITKDSQFYNRSREDPEELVDYDEVKTVDVEINTGSRNIRTSNFLQQSPDLVLVKLREDEKELVDYDEVKNENEEIKAGSPNNEMKHNNKKYSNQGKQKQSTQYITQTSSMNDTNIYSTSLGDLLETFNMPANDKLDNNPKNSSNDLKMKKMNDELYNKGMMQETSYGFKTNTKNLLLQSKASSSKNMDLDETIHETTTSRNTRTKKKSLNSRVVEGTTNNEDEDKDYDYIKN